VESLTDSAKEAIVRQLISDFHTTLTSTAAVLVTVSAGLYAFTVNLKCFPIAMILYSSVAYLMAVIFGVVAHGAVISTAHYGQAPFDSWYVRIPAVLQWLSSVAGSVITTWMLYLMVA
jgi:hypothetical protein